MTSTNSLIYGFTKNSLDASLTSISFPSNFLGSCPSVNSFEKLHRIGQGTYGVVYKARDRRRSSGDKRDIVALKRIRMDHSESEGGLPLSSLREISLLRQIQHENIVRVLDVAVGESSFDSLFLVMEYCEQDMAHLLDTLTGEQYGMKRVFTTSHVKCLMEQLLKGVSYLHSRFIIHRDLKLSNLLLTDRGILKIADFGLARRISDPATLLTPRVVTLWYRAPELLLGAEDYTKAIDIWAVGCIFGEFLKSKPLLPGRSEPEQMALICKLLGNPSRQIWPELPSLPLYKSKAISFPTGEGCQYDSVQAEFEEFSENTKKLLKSMLIYSPRNRISARKALKHDYFEESPVGCHPSLLPTFPETRIQADMKQKEAKDRYDQRRLVKRRKLS